MKVARVRQVKPIVEQPPLNTIDMKNINVYVAMPMYQGVVHGSCMLSLFKLSHTLRSAGIRHCYYQLDGEMVARARNRILGMFLETDCTHCLFIDHDITFETLPVIDLIRANLYVAGGIYPKKQFRWQAMFKHAMKGGKPETMAEAGLSYVINALPGQRRAMTFRGCIPAARVGTGFLLLKREAVERMIKRYPKRRYTDDFEPEKKRKLYALFDYALQNDQYLSEDYFFCDLWRKMGGTVWASCNLPRWHSGNYTFQGNFGRMLRPVKVGVSQPPMLPAVLTTLPPVPL